MSFIDVGKSAKHMGKEHPRNARRIDHEPAKPTPKAEAKKAKKRFGFTVERRTWREPFVWETRSWSWHETAKQRDQAMASFVAKHTGWWLDHYRNPQPIER